MAATVSIFSDLRSLVFLRRCAIALERIATAQETIASFAREADDRRTQEGYRPRPKPMVVGMFSQVEASRQWRQMQIDNGTRTREELDDEYGALPEDR